MDIQPGREAKNDMPTIGIVPAEGARDRRLPAPGRDGRPAGLSRARSVEEPKTSIDTLAAAGPADQEPKPLASHEDYERLLAGIRDRPIKHVIERRSASVGEDGPVEGAPRADAAAGRISSTSASG